jgi:hypothetical protein
MPGPFPGMDPYLEDPKYWKGVHHQIISVCFELLNQTLPPSFAAQIEERIYIQDKISLSYIEVREPFLEIFPVDNPEQIITTIEVLSPTNKTRGDGYEEYRRKQRQLLQSDTHLLEIDLLRDGTHTIAAEERDIRSRFGLSEYRICLHRAAFTSDCEVWPVRLPEQLPTVSVPLTADFPDHPLDLQNVLNLVWERGPFRRTTDYSLEPTPSLNDALARWANDLLIERSFR